MGCADSETPRCDSWCCPRDRCIRDTANHTRLCEISEETHPSSTSKKCVRIAIKFFSLRYSKFFLLNVPHYHVLLEWKN